MDWLSTIIGAAIGFLSSIGIIFVQRLFDRVGNLDFFAKVVYDRSTGSYTWGFYKNADGVFLKVPLWIEIQNLSNSTRIIRDINLLLVSKGKELVTMIQSNRADIKNQEIYLFANGGSYSLSLGGGEIKKSNATSYSKQVLISRLLMRYTYDTMMRSAVCINFL